MAGGGEMSDKILRRPEVQRRVGMGRSTLYAAIAEGRFPRPVNLGARAVGWLETEVDDWLAARVAERDARAVACGDARG